MNILMPQLGETVAEGKITKWFKSAGDAVQPGDNLFEIETDKVSMEVPATEAGVLSEIRVSEGEVVPVGAIVAVIGGTGRPLPVRLSPHRRQRRAPKTAGVAGCSTASRSAQTAPSAPAPQQPIKLDPFFEVRTPARNFRIGAAFRRYHRHATGAPARERSRHRSLTAARLRTAWPHRRARCGKRAAADCTRCNR